LEEWEDDSHTPKMGTWELIGILEISKFDPGVKTPHIEAFFISLKNYQSVDVKNVLA
jgi:hypothetical protein